MRTVFGSVDDLRQIVPDLTESELASSDFGVYSREDYLEDVGRLTQYRCNPELVEVLVDNSFGTLRWMRQLGVRFQAGYGRQAVKVNGRFKFWGGLPCEAWGGGPCCLPASNITFCDHYAPTWGREPYVGAMAAAAAVTGKITDVRTLIGAV